MEQINRREALLGILALPVVASGALASVPAVLQTPSIQFLGQGIECTPIFFDESAILVPVLHGEFASLFDHVVHGKCKRSTDATQ